MPYETDLMKTKVEISDNKIPIPAPSDSRVVLEVANLRGLDRQLEKLRRRIDRINGVLDDHYRSKRYKLPTPILLHGSAGVGKTAVLQSLATANWSKIVHIESSKIGVAKAKFAEACCSQPSLVILDDLEMIAGRDSDSGQFSVELTKCIKELSGSRVQVIAATNKKFDIHEKLLRAFGDCTIELPIPTKVSRADILKDLVLTETTEEIRSYVASRTHAFTADDLVHLCSEASDCADQRIASKSTCDDEVNETEITRDDFDQAMQIVHPSIMAEAYIEVPEVHWTDIAGSTEVKNALQHAVELPLKRPDVVKGLNLRTNSGILMYGPPGCSKTLTAKALATDSGLNFIAVQGPSLISKFVGESEQKIRDIFRKAREAAPSVIFFDEIDSIAPNRGSGHEGLNTVATLLNEMDGVEAVTKVLVLAATNRPDAIDPALLRPGRLGATIFVGPPDKEAIYDILKMHTDKMFQAGDLGLSEIAEKMVEDTQTCYSGADVAELCHKAGDIRAEEAMKKGELEFGLRRIDLETALFRAKPTLSKEAVENLRGWSIAGVNKVG